MQGKDKVSALGLDARLMVAEKLVNSESYDEIRDELRFHSTPDEAMPSDPSFRAYKETEEYRQIHLAAIAGQQIGIAAIGVRHRLHDLENVTREAAMLAIWRDLQDESLGLEQRLKVLDRLRGLHTTDLRVEKHELAERKYNEGAQHRSLDLLTHPAKEAMKAARMVDDYQRTGEDPSPTLTRLLDTVMTTLTTAIQHSDDHLVVQHRIRDMDWHRPPAPTPEAGADCENTANVDENGPNTGNVDPKNQASTVTTTPGLTLDQQPKADVDSAATSPVTCKCTQGIPPALSCT